MRRSCELRASEQLAREYEPSVQTLYKWKRGMFELNGVKTVDIEAELRRLKRENRQLREDKAILEKAADWFAKAQERGRSR